MKHIQVITSLIGFIVYNPTTAAPWSPDGQKIAYSYIGNPENIYVVDQDGNNPITLLARAQRDFRPEWSPDGSHLIITSVVDKKHVTYTVDLSGKAKQITTVEDVIGGAQYNSDGTQFLYFTDEPRPRDLYVRNLKSGRDERLTNTPGYDEYSARWNSDNQQIVYVKKGIASEAPGDLWLLNRLTGENQNITKTSKLDEFHPSWSHDGQKIVFIEVNTGQFNVVMLDLNTMKRHKLASGEGYAVLSPHFSPDDKWVSFTRTDFAEKAENLPAIVKVCIENKQEVLITRWK